jgi:hypothetical protein
VTGARGLIREVDASPVTVDVGGGDLRPLLRWLEISEIATT